MNLDISRQLDVLVNQTVFYQGQNHKIEKWKLVGGNYCIITTSRTLQFYPSEIQLQFLNKIKERQNDVDALPAEVNGKQIINVAEENTTIKGALLEALKKVKEDPAFLQQAKSICDIANTMVNVQKTEIEMIKLQKDYE